MRTQLAATLAATALLSTATPAGAQQPTPTWSNVGHSRPADGYSPSLTLRGVPHPGHAVIARIDGGVPNGTALLYFGDVAFGSDVDTSLAPSLGREFTVLLDRNGSATRSLVWPASLPGTSKALQSVIETGSSAPPVTPAIVGTTLSESEAAAYAAATAGAEGWIGVSVSSVEDTMKIESEADRFLAAELMALEGALPNIDDVDDQAGAFDYGAAPDFYLPGAPEFVNYASLMHAWTGVGNDLVQVTWESSSVGKFTSYMLVDSSGAFFDTFGSQFPSAWPLPASATGTSGHFPASISLSHRNMFGSISVSMTATSIPICSGGTLSSCHVEESSQAGFMWDAEVTTECTKDGKCCTCTSHMAAASGFKSVSVQAGGVGISISGGLGYSMSQSSTHQNCCK